MLLNQQIAPPKLKVYDVEEIVTSNSHVQNAKRYKTINCSATKARQESLFILYENLFPFPTQNSREQESLQTLHGGLKSF